MLLTACSWASTKWAQLGPELGDGTVIMRASAGRDGDQRLADLDDQTLVARLVEDLAMTMGLRGEPSSVRVTRWPRSFPQYRPGHLSRVAAAEADLAGHAPTIALAGAALRGVGVPACIKSGIDAAGRLRAALDRSATV
jgi:oxygen-dependent protoporphyrinogen oxidase